MTANKTEAPALRARRALRVPLLLALVVAAAGALFVQPVVITEVREGTLDPTRLLLAPIAFTVVVVLAALDTWRLGRARGYLPGRNVLVVVSAAAFVGLLLPQTLSEYRARTAPSSSSTAHYGALLKSKDARVRAVVMEAVGFRPLSNAEAAATLEAGLADPDPLVMESARQAVAHRLGAAQLTVPEALAATKSWR